jgi:hypothetical protein
MSNILPLRCSSIGNYRVDDSICPANWKQEYDNRFTGLVPATKEMKFGTAWHAAILGQLVDTIPWAAWLFAQTTPTGRKQFDADDIATIDAMCAVMSRNKTVQRLLNDTIREKQMEMEIDGVLLTGKPDAVGKRIIELKTTSGASPKSFAASINNYGYHYQAAGYRLLTGVQDFIWIAQEKKPPYLISIFPAAETLLNTAEMELMEILKIHKNCCLNDEWPGYDLISDNRAGIMPPIELPAWYKMLNINL